MPRYPIQRGYMNGPSRKLSVIVMLIATMTVPKQKGIVGVSSFVIKPSPLFLPKNHHWCNNQANQQYKHQQHQHPNKYSRVLMAEDGDDFFDGYDEFMESMKQPAAQSNDDWNDADFNPRPQGGGRSRDNNRGGGGGYNNNRGGGGGGGGYIDSNTGHDYTRANDDDESLYPVDEPTVNSLLAERLRAKKKRRFEEADSIRDELREEYGVIIWDKDKVWTSNPNSRGGSPRHRGNGRYADNNKQQSRGRDRGPVRERDFGPTGHDYSQSAGTGIDAAICPLSEDEIHALIAERLQCKMSRDFYAADQLQLRLEDDGVFLHDGFKEWRADGEALFGEQKSSNRDRPVREYLKQAVQDGLSEDDKLFISEKVMARSQAKRDGLFDLADEIREDLSRNYGVSIDDRNFIWFVRGTEYMQSTNSDLLDDPSGELKKLIESKLAERSQAKAAKEYETADAIREDLGETYSVFIDDRLKEWRFENPGFENGPSDDDEYVDQDTTKAQIDPESTGSAPTINDPESLASLTVPQLKETLREAGLPVSGKKAELIERIISAVTIIEDSPTTTEEEAQVDELDPVIDDSPTMTTNQVDDIEPEPENTPINDQETLKSLTVPQLKEKLRDAGLPVSGKKADLIDRLLESV